MRINIRMAIINGVCMIKPNDKTRNPSQPSKRKRAREYKDTKNGLTKEELTGKMPRPAGEARGNRGPRPLTRKRYRRDPKPVKILR